jgi:hypothetical protein
MICVFFIIRLHYKKKYASSNMLAKNANSDPSSRSDLEGGSLYYGVPVYSYSELEEATNNFDIEKELGDGGFGIVYYGKMINTLLQFHPLLNYSINFLSKSAKKNNIRKDKNKRNKRNRDLACILLHELILLIRQTP